MNIRYSLVVPVYKNGQNIADLLPAVEALQASLPDMECIFVVDGSPDNSWHLLREGLKAGRLNAQLIALARNFGSFAAIRTGLERARGEFIGVMAADLQEPPELVLEMFRRLERDECDVAFGQRTGREDPSFSAFCSSLFWSFYRKWIIRDMPAGGVDIFACNKKVAAAVLAMREVNTSLVAQLFWVGYRRCFVAYKRQARKKGKSAWTFGKKLAYMLDSLFAFSDLPMKLLLWLGCLGLFLSGGIGLFTLCMRLAGLISVPGYTALLLVVLFTFSIVILSQGILGCYLWRCFENTKNRPQSLVACSTIYCAAGNRRTKVRRAAAGGGQPGKKVFFPRRSRSGNSAKD